MSIEQCKLISLPKIVDPRGNLTFIEGMQHIPFAIQRVYYTYDVPGGGARGGHAHRQCEAFIIPINGSIEVSIDDGRSRTTHRLYRADQGLYLTTGIWRELSNFTSGSVCLVLASHPYEEADYIRDYEGFVKAVENGEFDKC